MSTIDIRVTNLGGESITEGTIGEIYKKEGDQVQKDDVVLVIDTDKTTLEITSPAVGYIKKMHVGKGDDVRRDTLLTELCTEMVDQNIKQEEKATDNTTASKKDAPSAQKMMRENEIKPNEIEGTGMGSRITKSDVIDHINRKEIPTAINIQDDVPSRDINVTREKRVKMSKIRQVIAARLKESQNTAAILTTFNEIDMKNVMDLRIKYKDPFEKKHGVKLGFMSFFIKAVTLALKEVPEINAEISKDEIIYKNYYDIGVAVGTDKGLVVPVIRNADQMSFAEIENTLIQLSKNARENKLQVADLIGATFTISNGGIYGSLLSTPIINPPQSGILGMHTIQNRPVAIGNSIEIRPMMYIALSYDHRIVDGKGAVTFLAIVKQYIEDPNRLALGV
ncbi:2-oxoglutarate dehydrogenase complex dihydrolipoyllysine-residue succinyltransferase [Candidatus Mesenet endosymbiont of Phosphuga atrata]|uniref:2-oxoglutarate dehydrogenase complex dihydrolipoyllysine-residue succinyltransferase n=1 Tax=Candidatus Mesenet endosymbiont of Phosphuga atrata TaxID=3066221 RepID=UPI0030CDFF50